MRRTNTYEESSLGIYARKGDEDTSADDAKGISYMGLHIRKQLAFDLWYVVFGVFIVLIAEKDKVADTKEDASYTLHYCICKSTHSAEYRHSRCSRYFSKSFLHSTLISSRSPLLSMLTFSCSGNVGLSRGYPGVSTSLAGKFGIVSKLVLCAMMIRGRHRELPYEIDRAVSRIFHRDELGLAHFL